MPAAPAFKFSKTLKKTKLERDGTKVKIGLGDFVHVVSDNSTPFIARVVEMGVDARGSTMARMQWMYRISDLKKKPENVKRNEIFLSLHTDINPIESVMEQVRIHFTDEEGNVFLSPLYGGGADSGKSSKTVPQYVCYQEYDTLQHKLFKLTKKRLYEVSSFVCAGDEETKRDSVSPEPQVQLPSETKEVSKEVVKPKANIPSKRAHPESDKKEIAPPSKKIQTVEEPAMSKTPDTSSTLKGNIHDGKVTKPPQVLPPVTNTNGEQSIVQKAATSAATQPTLEIPKANSRSEPSSSLTKTTPVPQLKSSDSTTKSHGPILTKTATSSDPQAKQMALERAKQVLLAAKGVSAADDVTVGTAKDMRNSSMPPNTLPNITSISPAGNTAKQPPTKTVTPDSQATAVTLSQDAKVEPTLQPIPQILTTPLPIPVSANTVAVPTALLASSPIVAPSSSFPKARIDLSQHPAFGRTTDSAKLKSSTMLAPKTKSRSVSPAPTIAGKTDNAAAKPAPVVRRRGSGLTLDELDGFRMPSLDHPQGKIRVGSDFQAAIPVYIGRKPSEPTAKDEIVWSPRATVQTPVSDSFTEKLDHRGSVVPVAILEPYAKFESDRKRVLWIRVAQPLDQFSGQVRGVPVDVCWPKTEAPASFMVQTGHSLLNIPKKAILQPETSLEQSLVNGYMMSTRRSGDAEDSVYKVRGLDEVLESWTEHEYDEFCIALRGLKHKSQLSLIAKAVKTKTTQEVVELFWAPRRSGLASAPVNIISCSVCSCEGRPVVACRRYFECKSAVCSACFKDARSGSKVVESDREHEQGGLDPFEFAKYSHWFCKQCNRKFGEDKKGKSPALPSSLSSTLKPYHSVHLSENSLDKTNISSISSSDITFRNSALASGQVLLRAHGASSIVDILQMYDEKLISAEGAMAAIRESMVNEAKKALALKPKSG